MVRHGQTAGNRDNRFIGITDLALTELGLQQAVAVAPLVDRFDPDVVVSSPLQRAKDTAAAAVGNRPVTIDPALREVDFGTWEGRTFDEVAAFDPDGFAAFDAGVAITGFPSGDSVVSVADAAANAIRSHAATRLLVFSHATTIRLVWCALLGLPISSYRSLVERPANGSWSQLHCIDGVWQPDAFSVVPGGEQ